MGRVRGHWAAALMLLAASPATAADASSDAAPVPDPTAITLEVTPYFWAAGLKGTFTLGHDIPPVHFDESFWTILDELKMTFMAAAAVRSGRFALNADVFYVKTALPFHLHEILTFNGQLDSELAFTTLTGSYRLAEGGGGHLDLFGGVRFWWLDNSLELSTVTPPLDIDIAVNQSWVDPVVGVGGRINLGERLYLSGYADIGGYVRPDDVTWQLAGGIGYAVKDHFDISAGYRIVRAEHKEGPITQILDVSGPVIAGSLRF